MLLEREVLNRKAQAVTKCLSKPGKSLSGVMVAGWGPSVLVKKVKFQKHGVVS